MNLSQEEIEAMMSGASLPASDDTGSNEKAAEAADAVSDAVSEPKDGDQAVSEDEPLDASSFLAEYTESMESSPESSSVSHLLTTEEADTLGEVGNICMGAVATTMFMLLDRRVEITTPRVEVLAMTDVLKRFPAPLVVVEVEYVEGILGRNLLLLEERDAALITDVLMGGEGVVEEPIELSELHMSAINEIMNQMIGASATALSQIIGRATNISTPQSRQMSLDGENAAILGSDEILIVITFDMEIDGLLSSQLVQFMPYNQGRELVADLTAPPEPEPEPAAPAAAAPAPAPPTPTPEPAPAYAPAFSAPAPSAPAPSHGSLNLIHDIPVQVSVELGRTKKEIIEILEFDAGTVVVLDKIAGDPVEVLVNGKLVASGEVVVIDENYGVRITALHG